MKIKKKTMIMYLIILLVSLLPCFALFDKGFIKGHDNAFHYAQIQDLYDKILNGQFFNHLNFETNHCFGMGVKLMYAPLSHLFVVLIGFLIIPFGFSLTSAMKVTFFLSILLSGIFTFHLIKKLSNNSFVALCGAIIYILFPYRYTDIYIRNAFAETIAMAFIPLVFNGLYSIVKLKEFAPKPFIITIIGTYLVFMTHNITAIYTFIFAGIFILFYIKDIIYLCKKPFFYIASFISLFILICLISPLLFPMLEHMNLNMYRIFDAEAMNTGLENVLNGVKNSFIYLSCETIDDYKSYIYFILLFLSLFFVLKNMNFDNKNEIITFTISISIFLIILIASIIVNVSLVIYPCLLFIFPFTYLLREKENSTLDYKQIIAFTLLTIITYLLITTEGVWKILPSFLYTIQFPWRLWAFFGLFIAILISLTVNTIILKSNKNIINLGLATLAISTLILLRPIRPNNYKFSEDNQISIKDTYYIYSAGWQLEYFPIEFYEGPKSTFFWRCYHLMQEPSVNILNEIYINTTEASFNNYTYDKGVISFDLSTTTDCVVQVPRIYYLGYQITISNGDEKIKLTPTCVEGFLSFETNLSGHVEIKYVGTPLCNSSFYLSFFGTGLLIAIPVLYKYKKKIKQN